MEEKDSEISGPCEEFRIYFCGEVSSGSVAWYFIDVSEKTESSTEKLKPFSESNHFPSVYYAFLKGCIYSHGGLQSDETLLNDVWILDIKSLDSSAARGEEKQKEKQKEPEKQKEKQKEPEKQKEKQKQPQKQKEKQKQPEKLRPRPRSRLRESVVVAQIREIIFNTFKNFLGHSTSDSMPPHPLDSKTSMPDFDFDFGSGSGAGEPSKPDSGSGEPSKPNYMLPWIRGPAMTFARCNPHTMVVDQKLYVLGGFEPNQNQLPIGWIEVYDPVVEKWKSLPSPPDQIHSSVMISGLLKAKKEIIIAKQEWNRDPMLFYSYNIMTRCWKPLVTPESKASVHLPPNAGRAVTVGNTLYWISTEEHNHKCIIRAYDLDRNMWFEDHLNTATIFESDREHFSSIYSSRPGFLHLRDQKFCLLLQSSITKDNPESSIEYLYCVILDISPIYEHEDRGKFKRKKLSVQKYSMDQYIEFLDCMLVLEDRVSGVKTIDRGGQSTSSDISFQEVK